MKTHMVILYVRSPDRSQKDAQLRVHRYFMKQRGLLAQEGFHVISTGRVTNFNLKGSDHPSMQPKNKA
jgi:hypothetical protein